MCFLSTPMHRFFVKYIRINVFFKCNALNHIGFVVMVSKSMYVCKVTELLINVLYGVEKISYLRIE